MTIEFMWGPLNGQTMEMYKEKPDHTIKVSTQEGLFWYELEMYDDVKETWLYALAREKRL